MAAQCGDRHIWRRLSCGLMVIIGWLSSTAWGFAQAERYELGRRLRLLELAFEQQKDPQARSRAYPHINNAVNSFFAFKFGEVGRSIDQAQRALANKSGVTAAQQWADSLFFVLERRLHPAEQCTITFTVRSFYGVEATVPDGARLSVALIFSDGTRRPLPESWGIKDLPLKGTATVKDLPEGDAELEYKISVDEDATPLATGKLGIAFVNDLEKRLGTLIAAVDDLPATAASVEEATLRTNVQMLKSLASNYSPETDYPAARLLKEAEDVLGTRRAGEAYYGQGKTGQYWLTLLTGRTRTIVRLLAPTAAAKREPLPLVIALHGAGGSENMFFDVYGHGKIVDLCQDRGWLLVAPRSGGFGGAPLAEVIDEVAKLYPVDSRRVFVVGHSMGAAQALLNARLTPERFTAIAALGGGRPISVSEAMKAPAYFVGIGTKDFAYRGAKALGDALKAAQVPHLTYKEYPDVEHLMIVQISLDDVFHFFEEAAGQREPKR